MPWPFSNVAAPTFTTNVASMPTSLTSVTTGTVYLLGCSFTNSNTTPVTITVQSTDGTSVIANQSEIPGKGVMAVEFAFNFRPMVGLSWQASASGVSGSIWGY